MHTMYICEGGCRAAVDRPWHCGSDSCSHRGQPMVERSCFFKCATCHACGAFKPRRCNYPTCVDPAPLLHAYVPCEACATLLPDIFDRTDEEVEPHTFRPAKLRTFILPREMQDCSRCRPVIRAASLPHIEPATECGRGDPGPLDDSRTACEPHAPPINITWENRTVTYTRIAINGIEQNVASVTANSEVTMEFSYTSRFSRAGAYCPGCIVQAYIGIQGHFSHGFIEHGINTIRRPLHDRFTFRAPPVPGAYYVTQEFSLCYAYDPYKSHSNDFDSAVAMIRVVPEAWAPDFHYLYPSYVKEEILTVLLSAARHRKMPEAPEYPLAKLPGDIFHHVIQAIGRAS